MPIPHPDLVGGVAFLSLPCDVGAVGLGFVYANRVRRINPTVEGFIFTCPLCGIVGPLVDDNDDVVTSLVFDGTWNLASGYQLSCSTIDCPWRSHLASGRAVSAPS